MSKFVNVSSDGSSSETGHQLAWVNLDDVSAFYVFTAGSSWYIQLKGDSVFVNDKTVNMTFNSQTDALNAVHRLADIVDLQFFTS